MRRGAFLLLPVVGLVCFDPLFFDYHAAKYALLGAAALACLALARGRFVLRETSLALALFVAVRGAMLVAAPESGRGLRWWALLVVLALVHHAAPRVWLRRRAPRLLGPLAALLAALGLAQIAGGAPQANITFANRSFAGAGLAMLLPFALAHRRGRFLAPVVLLALLTMKSRGGAVAAATALAVWFAWGRPKARAALLLALPTLALAVALLFGEMNPVKQRLSWYRAAFGMGLERPLLGEGEDGFAREYPPVRLLEEYQISGGDRVHAVHNDYLESFANGGAIGLLAHLFLLFAAWRAARRNRTAAASLAALAVASAVDLPLRDPSLLALALFVLTTVARRRRRVRGAGWIAIAAALLLLLPAAQHWRADRAYQRGDDDAALAHEPGHPEALLRRRRPDDLDRLLRQQPHHARAHLHHARGAPDEVERLDAVLLHHDPHDPWVRVRLAALTDDRVRAVSLLTAAIEANPRLWRPYLFLAGIYRDAGSLAQAEEALAQAEARSDDTDIRRARLDLELTWLREGRAPTPQLGVAVAALPEAEMRAHAQVALDAAAALETQSPRVPRVPGESALEHARRIQESKAEWQRGLDEQTGPHYREAYYVAEALAMRHRRPHDFRLLARAARGRHELDRAGEAEATASFLEFLAAVERDDATTARRALRTAVRAYPGLPREPVVRDALIAFLAKHRAARARALELLRPYPELFNAVAEGE